MKMTRRLVVLFALVALAMVAGCASDYDDSSDDCIDCSAPDTEPSEDSIEPPSPRPQGCQQACSALLYECRLEDDIRLKGNVEPCIEWCQNGGLDQAEVTCLAEADCSSSVEHCLIGE